MALKPDLPAVRTACFRIQLAGGGEGPEIPILFNPASLEYSVSNELKDQKGGKKKQYVEKSKASLKMQLVFDSTDTGLDVRAHTGPVSRLLQPVQEEGKPVPPTVKFEWGIYAFTGMVEQYKEVLDFFSNDGVPLRSTVDVTLSDQDFQFREEALGSGDTSGGGGPETAVVPAGPGGASDVANRLGDPRAARQIASANGAASLRAGASGGMAVGGGAGISLQAEAGFSAGASAGLGFAAGASAGAGLGVGGSAGIGGGIGAGAGASIGFGAGAQAGAGLSLGAAGFSAGAGASAGASASSGLGAGGFSASASAGTASAFAGLRLNVPPPPPLPSAKAVFSASFGAGAEASVAVGGGAQIGLSGKASAGVGGLSADVGADADLNALIKFG